MIELPEAITIARQINDTLAGNRIADVLVGETPHAFAQYTGDTALYRQRLVGKQITASSPGTRHTSPGCVEIECEDMLLHLTTPVRYTKPDATFSPKNQLMISLVDGGHITCSVQMWGSMFCYPIGKPELPEGYTMEMKPSPMDDAFDRLAFDALCADAPASLSVKGLIATEGHMPGVGNGCAQDILFNARLNPRVKVKDLTDVQQTALFDSVKRTLRAMVDAGGRDTERDLFGNSGGYKTILSAKTMLTPCPVCGSKIVREAYMGGNVYYCPVCQPYEKRAKRAG